MAPSNGSSTGLCGRRPPSRSSRAPPPSEATEGVETPGNYHAAQLCVAEQYVEKLGLLAKENDTMIVPITVGDVSSIIAKRRAPYDRGRDHPALVGNVAFRRPSCRDVLPTSSALCGRLRVQATDFLCRRRRTRPRVVEPCQGQPSHGVERELFGVNCFCRRVMMSLRVSVIGILVVEKVAQVDDEELAHGQRPNRDHADPQADRSPKQTAIITNLDQPRELSPEAIARTWTGTEKTRPRSEQLEAPPQWPRERRPRRGEPIVWAWPSDRRGITEEGTLSTRTLQEIVAAMVPPADPERASRLQAPARRAVRGHGQPAGNGRDGRPGPRH